MNNSYGSCFFWWRPWIYFKSKTNILVWWKSTRENDGYSLRVQINPHLIQMKEKNGIPSIYEWKEISIILSYCYILCTWTACFTLATILDLNIFPNIYDLKLYTINALYARFSIYIIEHIIVCSWFVQNHVHFTFIVIWINGSMPICDIIKMWEFT